MNFDTSLSKRFAVIGRTNVEFRWDAFNLFNHPGFGFPNQNFDSPTAGRITSTIVDNRSMQFSLKLNFRDQSKSFRRLGDQEVCCLRNYRYLLIPTPIAGREP